MSFLNPTALWGLILAIPLIAVYLVRNRPSVCRVATLLFWEQVAEEPAASSLFRRLRSPASLLLQLAVLLLLVLALSQPVLNSSPGNAGRVVIVIDNSASMNAGTTDNESRFRSAITNAADLIANAAARSEFAIVVTCPTARVMCPVTTSRTVALNQLNELQPTDQPSELTPALRLADSLASNRDQHQVTVFTDAQHSPMTDPGRSQIRRIGSPVDNVALTKFRAQRSDSDPLLWQLLVEVANYSKTTSSGTVQIRREDELIDILPFSLDPDEVFQQTLSFTSAAGGMVSGKIAPQDAPEAWDDGLAADDKAWTMVAERPSVSVALVSENNWFLTQVLNANPLVDLEIIRPQQFAEISKTLKADVVIFDAFLPDNWPPPSPVRPIRALCVAPPQSTSLWTVEGEIQQTFVGDHDSEHPLVEFLQLEEVLINAAVKIRTNEPSETVISELDGHPLLASFERNGDRILVFTVDLNRSDLPLRTTFPILLTNCLDWLTVRQPTLLPQGTTGTSVTVDLPNKSESSTGWELVHPDGFVSPVAVVNNKAVTQRLSNVGVYQLRPGRTLDNAEEAESKTIRLPCNLSSAEESRVNRSEPARNDASRPDFVASTPTLVSLPGFLIVLCLLAIVAECWMWHRRIIE